MWEVALLTSAVVAASHLPVLPAAANDIIDMSPGEDVDAAGIPVNINNTKLFRLPEESMDIIAELQEQGVDAAGLPINTNENYTMFEEEINFDSWNSIEERKACFPTTLCTRNGGYCVKSRKDCDGMVDPRGCKGGKRCKCCIPDQTTPAPCPTCAPCTSTTPEGTTVSSNLNWMSVGADRFVRFDQMIPNWNVARTLCRSHGLDLYHPSDILAVSKYLDDNFSNGRFMWHWLGARGNGTHQVWISGGVLTRDDPWYSTYYTRVGTDDCLYFVTHSGNSEKGHVLVASDCVRTNTWGFYSLCG